jgi:glycerol-3-phosphate dehydrogenase
MTEVLVECLPDCEPAILSGPSFAKDVARSLPTAVTIAAKLSVARALQELSAISPSVPMQATISPALRSVVRRRTSMPSPAES